MITHTGNDDFLVEYVPPDDFEMFVTAALLRIYDVLLVLVDDEDVVEGIRALHSQGVHQWS